MDVFIDFVRTHAVLALGLGVAVGVGLNLLLSPELRNVGGRRAREF